MNKKISTSNWFSDISIFTYNRGSNKHNMYINVLKYFNNLKPGSLHNVDIDIHMYIVQAFIQALYR